MKVTSRSFSAAFGVVSAVAGLCVVSPLLTLPARAQTVRAVTPAVGGAERKKIMDALRVPVKKELKQNVIFKVSHLKVQKGWAFITAEPLQPNGESVNYRKTRYAEAVREGFFGGEVGALLHRVNGKWRVVNYVIGPTDVAWEGWDRRYGAPSSIFVMN